MKQALDGTRRPWREIEVDRPENGPPRAYMGWSRGPSFIAITGRENEHFVSRVRPACGGPPRIQQSSNGIFNTFAPSLADFLFTHLVIEPCNEEFEGTVLGEALQVTLAASNTVKIRARQSKKSGLFARESQLPSL
jgi:hypothetical protein